MAPRLSRWIVPAAALALGAAAAAVVRCDRSDKAMPAGGGAEAMQGNTAHPRAGADSGAESGGGTQATRNGTREVPGSHSPGPWSARPSERGVPWPPGATFEEQERAFLATGDEFAKIAAIDAWELSKETRALRTLIPASSAATEEGNDGSFIAGARLRALGSLGRLSSEGAARQAAGGALVDVVRAGARDPSPRLLGDALLACDALVELGLKETGTGLVSTFAVKSIPWPLAERVALTLEAIGAAERAEAGKTLSALLAATPNDTFRAMERDDKTRLRELGKRLAGPASP